MQQVLRTTTSASSRSSVGSSPSATRSPARRSESCSFIWHPKVRMWKVRVTSPLSAGGPASPSTMRPSHVGRAGAGPARARRPPPWPPPPSARTRSPSLAVADPEQRGAGPRPARRQRPRPDQARQQLGRLGEQRAAVVLVQAVLGRLPDEQRAVGQPGQEQRQSAQVEGGVGCGSPAGAAPGGPWSWAAPGRARWPRSTRPASRGMRTARTAPRTVVAATRPPTTEAAAFSGWPSTRAATASGSRDPAAAAAATARAADEPEPARHGDLRSAP